MQVQIHAATMLTSDAILNHVRERVEAALRHVAERVTRVEVHLHDLNGPRSGADKDCVIEARLNGQKPLAVRHRDDDLYRAVTEAAHKLQRTVRRRVGRLSRRAT